MATVYGSSTYNLYLNTNGGNSLRNWHGLAKCIVEALYYANCRSNNLFIISKIFHTALKILKDKMGYNT